jgi:inner membrane protein YidH
MADDGDHEPDYRFTLANERTFLAWMRTSLALLAGGIALRALSRAAHPLAGVRDPLALVAVLLSLVLAVASYARWRCIQQAMRQDEPLPHPLAVPLLATGVTILAITVALALVAG